MLVIKLAGPDGLCAEIYRESQEILAGPLLNMYSDFFKNGLLPDSFRFAKYNLMWHNNTLIT